MSEAPRSPRTGKEGWVAGSGSQPADTKGKSRLAALAPGENIKEKQVPLATGLSNSKVNMVHWAYL